MAQIFRKRDWVTIRVFDWKQQAVQPGDSRQVRRRKEFRAEHATLAKQYPGEPQKRLRAIAKAKLARQRNEARELQERVAA